MNVDHEITMLKEEIRRLGTPSKYITCTNSIYNPLNCIVLFLHIIYMEYSLIVAGLLTHSSLHIGLRRLSLETKHSLMMALPTKQCRLIHCHAKE